MKGIVVPKLWSIECSLYTIYLYAELSRILRVVSNPSHTVIMISIAVGNVQLSAHLLLCAVYLE